MGEISATSDSLDTVVSVAATSPRPANPVDRRHDAAAHYQDFTIQYVLDSLRAAWKVALPIGLVLATVAAGLVYVFFEPVYEASAWLQIAEAAPFVAFEPGGHAARGPSREFVATQVELLRSPLVLGPVVARQAGDQAITPEQQEVRIRSLAKYIEVSPVGQSQLVKVSYRSTEPKRSAATVNAVVDSFFEFQSRSSQEHVRRVITLLEKERAHRAVEVARLRERVREMTRQATGVDPFAVAAAAGTPEANPLSDLQGRLATIEVEREVLEARVKAREEELAAGQVAVADEFVERRLDEDAEVRRLEGLLAAKRSRLHEIESRSAMGKEDPFSGQLRREIAEDEKVIEEYRSEQRSRVKAEMQADLLNARGEELATLRSNLRQQQILAETLRGRYDSQLDQAKQLGGETLELEFKRSELAQAEEVFDLITTHINRLRTEQQAPAQVTLSRRAVTPTQPVEAVPLQRMTVAGLAGFCLPLVLLVSWKRMAGRVGNPRDLEHQLDLPTVAETPRLPPQWRDVRHGFSEHRQQDVEDFQESMDGLRTRLMLSEPLRGMRVLAVTSAVKQEGKTSVAAGLALSIARASGEPTLLVDGDMRSPDVHPLFNIPLGPGLAEVLAHQCAMEEAVARDCDHGLHVLPAGRLRTNAHTLLGNGALRSLLDQAAACYRYVIVDTPPVLAASEALVFAAAADTSLLCVMQESSRVEHVRAACERLAAAGAEPFGVVVNGVPTRRYAYPYSNSAILDD